MKAIMVNNNKILSLENVKEVELYESGTGAQKNPFRYGIAIDYMNGEHASSDSTSDKEKAKVWFNKIFEILTAE